MVALFDVKHSHWRRPHCAECTSCDQMEKPESNGSFLHRFPQTKWATAQPIGVLEASATPLALARIVPLWSVKKDLWPVVPSVTGLAAIA